MVMFPFQRAPLEPLLREIDRVRESLDAYPLVIGWRDRLASDLMAEAIQASTNMEGVPVTVEEVRRILAGDRPSSVSAESASLVTGYRDAMRYCQRRANDEVFTWSPELIKGIQDRILAGRSDWGAGLYGKGRFVQNSPTGELIYTPPQENVDKWMDALCGRMNQWAKTEHPAIQSAWVHIALAAIHPFKDGNGRTARVLASLAMYRGGFKRREFISLEEWWGRHRTEYANAFGCLGSAFNPGIDVTPFMNGHLFAQVQQLHILQNVERVRGRIWQGIEALISAQGLPSRTDTALWEAFWARTLTRPYYMSVSDIKGKTASNDLNALVAVGLLREDGRTRAKHWETGPQFFALLGAHFGLDAEHGNKDAITKTIIDQVVYEARAVTQGTPPAQQRTLWQEDGIIDRTEPVIVGGGTKTT